MSQAGNTWLTSRSYRIDARGESTFVGMAPPQATTFTYPSNASSGFVALAARDPMLVRVDGRVGVGH